MSRDDRPNLPQGFYEVESVRKKRCIKGNVQYLIKWVGWPEEANTWEPLENLISCSDIIDAFEERMSLERQELSRKNKGKQVVAPQPQKKKSKPHEQHNKVLIDDCMRKRNP
ncbi:hypothetical protein SSX86_027139 [Deinandra increscens subsp. villosa]|uniref:Chromo domain-containing protein n=1 Tax=Deinandra increscens subsp. villosa TaxID=3103831 RepID=A0AAP0GPP2_9ASTR